MDVEEKIALVKRRPFAEVITEDELRLLFESNKHPTHYIGFEISGMVHLGTGLMTAMKIKDFKEAGIKPTIFLADYHAWINGKLGGDLDRIQQVARGYFKSAFLSLGLDEGVDFVLASELYEKLGKDYWKDVLYISKSASIARMLRCTTIMGRSEKDALDCASILYPAMQAADIWALDIDIAHAGIDQRKVHVLSREMSEKAKRKKVIAIHGHLMTGLTGPGRMDTRFLDSLEKSQKEGIDRPVGWARTDEDIIQMKMSKSKPDSCIFIHDAVEDIERKIKNAYCPPKMLPDNPIMDICQYILLRNPDSVFKIERSVKFGGNLELKSFGELQRAYMQGKLHPMDLKNAVSSSLSKLLEPSRKYFEKHKELLAQV